MKQLTTLWMKALLMSWLVLSLGPIVEASIVDYSLTYNPNGNLKEGFGKSFEYNGFNQLTRVRQGDANGTILEEYLYDQGGDRVRKVEPLLNQTTYYLNDNFIKVVNSSGTFVTVFYYEGDTLIGRKDPDGKRYFYHPDHLGSTDTVTNESGDVVEETTYKPYGEIQSGGDSRFLFTGKELDDQTGLYYYGARYYDPFFSHFIQPDQNIPDVYNPQDLNRYAYVRNNPYKYVDPSGDIPVPIVTGLIGAAIGAAISGAVSAISQYKATGTISVGETAKAVGVGAVAGGVAGLTGYGIASLASGTLSGLGTGAAVLGSGALSGAIGGEAYAVTEAALTGQQYSFDPSRALINAGIGAGTAGVGYKIFSSSKPTFTNKESLSQHFQKHGSEFGFNSEQQYGKAAQQFLSGKPLKGVEQYTRPLGDMVRYNSKTNEFGVISREGTIRTYFKPEQGSRYYKRDKNRFRKGGKSK